MKSVFWEVGTCFFRSFHVLSKNFVPYKTPKKHEKCTIFRRFWFATFHYSFFSTFLNSVLRTDENFFLRVRKMFFRSFHLLSKNFVPYKTQET